METSASGLPKVDGLQTVLNQPPATQDKDPATNVQTPAQIKSDVPPTDGKTDGDVDWAQFKNADGTLNQEALFKSYKEIQGFTTRTSQENKQLKEIVQKLQEDMELRQYQTPYNQPITPKKTFEELFIENPRLAIQSEAVQIANTQRIAEVLEKKELENPTEFNERVVYIKMLSQQPQYAPLSNSARGVEKLFEIADKVRGDMLSKKAHESLKALFGDDVDIEKAKQFFKKDGTIINPNLNTNPQLNLNAYMPNTSTSTRTGADVDANMNDLQRQREEAVTKGDASTVARTLIIEGLTKK